MFWVGWQYMYIHNYVYIHVVLTLHVALYKIKNEEWSLLQYHLPNTIKFPLPEAVAPVGTAAEIVLFPPTDSLIKRINMSACIIQLSVIIEKKKSPPQILLYMQYANSALSIYL